MDRNQRNLYAVILASISGILFLVSGTTGVRAWLSIKEIVLENISLPEIKLVFTIILILASFGGLTILFGALMLFKNHIRTGKLFITIGAGSGIIYILINVYSSIVTYSFNFTWLFSTSSLGIILSIFARYLAKPSKARIL